jgi:predicted nucleotidyltransferase component of viral defense system
MERKVLTPFQKEVLIGLFNKGLGERGFYLTGGTALAEFYLHHRYSDDLDFHTRKSESLKEDFKRFLEDLEFLGLEIEIQRRFDEIMTLSVHLPEKKSEPLKMEFNRDATAMMAPALIRDTVIIDSFEDIAVNKVCTILSRGPHEPKDFADLYFILTESQFSLDYLIGRAREKEAAFDREEGILDFAIRLRQVKDPLIMPRMVKPLNHEVLSSYLTPLADELIRRLGPRS